MVSTYTVGVGVYIHAERISEGTADVLRPRFCDSRTLGTLRARLFYRNLRRLIFNPSSPGAERRGATSRRVY